jgi:hypothetical protein
LTSISSWTITSRIKPHWSKNGWLKSPIGTHTRPRQVRHGYQFERFFALLTDKKIKRGVWCSVAALSADITSFIDRHNADPKPFRQDRSADDILASIERFCRYNAPERRDVANFRFRTLGALTPYPGQHRNCRTRCPIGRL